MDMEGQGNAVSLGEVWRVVTEVKGDVKILGADLSTMALTQAALLTRVNALDRIVYGIAGISVSAFVAGVGSLLWDRSTG